MHIYVHTITYTATWFVSNTHECLPHITQGERRNQSSLLPSSLLSSFFLREVGVVPENIFLCKTATIPMFTVIVYLYKPCVNNPHVLVGLFHPWHMMLNQIIYITKYIQTKATFLNTRQPRPNHHLDVNCGLSFIKAGKIRKGTDKCHVSEKYSQIMANTNKKSLSSYDLRP